MKCIEEEIPFEVPEGWEWVRLGDLAQYKKGPFGSSITKSMFVPDSPNAIKVYEQKNAINKDATLGTYFITTEKYETLKSFEVFPNDIIVSCAGTIGETFVLPKGMRKGIINQALMKISLYDIRMLDYYLIYFDQELKISAKEEGHGIALKNIPPFDILKRYLVAMPPYEEQQRIVEQVNKLLNYVNDINDNKERLEEVISNTKAKILDVAIRGKLVPQEPEDEPASILLARIRAEKEELIKQGKLKRDKKESIIYKGDDNSYYQIGLIEPIEVPYEIPESWTWSNLKELCNYGVCDNISPNSIDDNAWILDLEDIEKDTGKVLYRATNAERKTSSTKHSFSKNMILYSKLRPYLNKVVLADQDGYCTSEIIPLKFSDIIVPRYAQFFLMSPYFVGYANHCSYGMKMPRLGTRDGEKAFFAIPPYQEQIRIVDMVEKIFSELTNLQEAITM